MTKEYRMQLRKEIYGLRKNLLEIILSPHVELTEEQRKDYETHNNLKAKPETHISVIMGLKKASEIKETNLLTLYKNEKDYIIPNLKGEIEFKKSFIKIDYCGEHGHLYNPRSESGTMNGSEVSGVCRRCKRGYSRGLSEEEQESWNNPPYFNIQNQPKSF